MPPRKLPKVGNRRIDAAINTLGQFGFSTDEVTESINRLLKVYGGEEAWPFIEESTYQVVMDEIFENRNAEAKEKVDDKSKADEKGKGVCGDPASEVKGKGVSDMIIDTEDTCFVSHRKRPPCYGWISDEDD